MKWEIKQFSELSTLELFNILKLRVDVFVVEQACAYPEIDAYDLEATHIFCTENDSVLAYCRIIKTPSQYKLGRVVVDPTRRGRQLGQLLVEKALQYCTTQKDSLTIYAQAQAYLERFYHSFGFKKTSPVYEEDGIPHIDMILSLKEELQ